MSSFAKLKYIVSKHRELLNSCIQTIEDQDVTSYPIFVYSVNDLEVGIELGNPQKHNINGYLKISSLEEFSGKKLIESEKIQNFIEVYKENEDKFCFLCVDEAESKFIFVPKDIHTKLNN